MTSTRTTTGKTVTLPTGNYRTSDLYYAAYLRVANVPFNGTEREGTRVFFLFEDSDSLNELKAQYFNRSAKIPAMTYADEIKAMKALTHA